MLPTLYLLKLKWQRILCHCHLCHMFIGNIAPASGFECWCLQWILIYDLIVSNFDASCDQYSMLAHHNDFVIPCSSLWSMRDLTLEC